MSALVHPLIRQAIGILLLWSGIVKFADLTGTRESITAYRLLPTGWVRVAALVLPLSEVSLAALLLLGNSPVVALSGVGLLFVIFASAQVINLVRGIRVPCGCFVERLAARSSRRSWLGGWCGVVMGAIGLELLPVLPADRRARAQAPTVNCVQWYWCGMTGTPCSDCKGGDRLTCPYPSQCCYAWPADCKNPADGKMYTITYYDCCIDKASNPYPINCGLTFCNNQHVCDANVPVGGAATYCYGGDTKPRCTNLRDYVCTVVRLPADAGGAGSC